MRSVGRMKVLSVVGNRPQFIKSAPLSLALCEAGIDEVVVHTGSITIPSCRKSSSTSSASRRPPPFLAYGSDPQEMQPLILKAIDRERPEWVLVFGDTNSTLAGAHAARTAGVPIAHVKAGLCSGDLSMPASAVDRTWRHGEGLSARTLGISDQGRDRLVAE